MRCDDADLMIEAVAAGEEPADDALLAHVASCPRCEARMRMARAIESVLAIRESPEPPERFTAHVLARVRRERWRAEQMLDAGFNLAVVFGLMLIVAGLGGLAWSFGLLGADSAVVSIISAGTSQLAQRLLPQANTIVLATLLLLTTMGLWWWAEEGFA